MILPTTNYRLQTTKKGVSLYLALIIMFILIAIGLGVSLIIVSQMKMMKGMGDSVVAFYAADTGIEHSLYNSRIEVGNGQVSGSVGDANYQVTSPSADTYQSKGWTAAGIKRAIEIYSPPPAPPPPPPPTTYTQDCLGDCGTASCSSKNKACPELCTKGVGACSIPIPLSCPDPLPYSHFVSQNCSCVAMKTGCLECDPDGTCVDYTFCNKTGICNYECDPGYTWDGTACVP
jgi:hypothetical protein